tara:strand:+ start:2729 stop:3262 length:534 start_codon:yes stop_codon:yes gene_type:complete
MGLGDLGNAILIIIIFILLNTSLSLSIGITKIKKNWSKYKCNPGIMPVAFLFGHDVNTTFNECVKSTQTDYMTSFLNPIYDSINQFAESGAKFSQIFEDLKVSSNKQDESMGDFSELLTNKLYNVSNATNEIFINVTDTFLKLSSSITVVYQFIRAAIGSAEGAWSGLIGTMIRLAV